MSAADLINRLKPILERWPAGMIVWHRADGKRGVICEHTLDGLGCVMIVVCFGANSSWDKCLVHELSAVKISDGTDGDEWKDAEATGGTEQKG
ncbi:hypothetical protein [Prosthecobacter sp.]|uniref:hypothetical protein n=1 Tax=Prosthecobacter sp. TaxID=1965333 RepID=UPI003784C44F